jgi:flavin reductase (DIM6/NTAB) family NADH-FMN oxidoreductase RutF
MILDLKDLSPNQVYYQFIQTLIPRPIAWVLTDNGNGSFNLAPFSYFNGIASDLQLFLFP